MRRAVTRWERAGGISERRRDVKMSARLAICCCVSTAVGKGQVTNLEVLLGLENLCQRLACLNTQGIAQKLDLLDLVVCL